MFLLLVEAHVSYLRGRIHPSNVFPKAHLVTLLEAVSSVLWIVLTQCGAGATDLRARSWVIGLSFLAVNVDACFWLWTKLGNGR